MNIDGQRDAYTHLVQIKDLNPVSKSLAANICVVSDNLNVPPKTSNTLRRESAKINNLPIRKNLHKGRSVLLPNHPELPSLPILFIGPSPDIVPYPLRTTK